MIKYHGTPLGGSNQEAAEALIGKHAFVSFAATGQLKICLDVCQSVALDNGAFSAWKSDKIVDWDKYFDWCNSMVNHPKVDFAVIPDVIDGSEEDNNALIGRFHARVKDINRHFGVPVWHLHESLNKLKYLAKAYPRVAFGSSAEYSAVGSAAWCDRVAWAFSNIVDPRGFPITKVHMLRGLNPKAFSKFPFSSADSTNAARNCTLDSRWKGSYPPPSPSWKARVIMARIEHCNSPSVFLQDDLII